MARDMNREIGTRIKELDADLKKQREAGYIKLDNDQLLALMATILVAGKCFTNQDSRSVVLACCMANEIFDRIIVQQEYTNPSDWLRWLEQNLQNWKNLEDV